jgi:Brp/Blh family beta-carotene 15,15'-monooxygenase
VIGCEVLVPGGWGSASWVVLVAGLLLGLPHGAVDHLLPAWRLGWRAGRLALFAAGYALLAAAGYAVFRWAPEASLAVFVVVSAWHFGTGETAFADLRAGRPVRRWPAAAATVGAVVLLLPLARGLGDPAEDVAAVLQRLAPSWNGMAAAGVAVPALAAAGGLLVLLLLRRRRFLEAVELATLLLLGLVVPPLAAFGVYFGAWHSVRHLARVLAEDSASTRELAAGVIGRPLSRFALAAAAPTVVVLLVLGLLWSFAGGWRGLVGTHLPLLAALTVPHVLVVSWLDGRPLDQAGSRRIGTCGMPSST